MRFYHWYYMKKTTPCYRLTVEIKSTSGFVGFMVFKNEFSIVGNMDNPTWLRDELFEEKDFHEFDRDVIQKLFTVSGFII